MDGSGQQDHGIDGILQLGRGAGGWRLDPGWRTENCHGGVRRVHTVYRVITAASRPGLSSTMAAF